MYSHPVSNGLGGYGRQDNVKDRVGDATTALSYAHIVDDQAKVYSTKTDSVITICASLLV
jgi:hypothetical protein